jgi:hypothetical protein
MVGQSVTTPGLTARETASLAKGPVGSLGGQWMTQDAEEQLTTDLGLSGWQLYFIARHAPLGDVDPDVIAASAYFFPNVYLRTEWQAARLRYSPAEALGHYLKLCHAWGRDELTDFVAADRLSDLAARVIEAANVAGLPLFAGWRAVEVPTKTGPRLAHLMQVMREYHGAVHGVAVVSSGMTPLMAVLANRGGVENAEAYGWQPPFPAVTDDDRRRRVEVEERTDDLAAHAYEVLDVDQRAELLTLLAGAHAHVFGS